MRNGSGAFPVIWVLGLTGIFLLFNTQCASVNKMGAHISLISLNTSTIITIMDPKGVLIKWNLLSMAWLCCELRRRNTCSLHVTLSFGSWEVPMPGIMFLWTSCPCCYGSHRQCTCLSETDLENHWRVCRDAKGSCTEMRGKGKA